MALSHLLFVLLLLLFNHHSAFAKPPINTIVILVMENRSFDNMIGWMKRTNPEINGVDGTESNPLNTTDPKSPLVLFNNTSQYVDPDPGHSFQAIRDQIFSDAGNVTTGALPTMNGFAQQAFLQGGAAMSADVMNGFTPSAMAVYQSLVAKFAVCDRWFASVPKQMRPVAEEEERKKERRRREES